MVYLPNYAMMIVDIYYLNRYAYNGTGNVTQTTVQNGSMFLRYVFSERFKKKMEEVFALFDKKDSEKNCPASPQNLRRIKQRKAPSSDAKLMIRPRFLTSILTILEAYMSFVSGTES